MKYIDGAAPYEEPCYGHLADAVIRELGVPLVTGDIPGVAVILGSAPSVEEGVACLLYTSSEFKLTTVEEMEAATARLLETGAKVGADAWQLRVKNQTPHCKFGEQGICCRICSMGPCRITPKAPRGICGCDAHGIVGRNFLKFTAGGAATHSDHGREICHTLHCAAPDLSLIHI